MGWIVFFVHEALWFRYRNAKFKTKDENDIPNLNELKSLICYELLVLMEMFFFLKYENKFHFIDACLTTILLKVAKLFRCTLLS